MSTSPPARPRRARAVLRTRETVSPLELFFDLVFVLALTQCTALMADRPSPEGVAQGMLVLAVLWWAWVGYAWLTSVVDPDEGIVRIAIFVAMAAFLVVSLCVPDAFEDLGLLFAGAYAVVRIVHVVLFTIASQDDPDLRRSIAGFSASTVVGVGLLTGAAFADGLLQGALWLVAFLLDISGPIFFGAEGWKLRPHHFAERHGLILIIALGESIVAIGIGAEDVVDAGVVVAAVLGIAVVAALWWLYFDVVATVAEHRLAEAAPGREQNEMARDSYSLLHLPMVAGIVLMALGMKKTIGHVGDPLHGVPASALLGGAAIYLVAHVLFRLRNVHTVNVPRLVTAAVLVALIPLALVVPALVSLGILAAVLCVLLAFETIRYAEARERVRHQLGEEPEPSH